MKRKELLQEELDKYLKRGIILKPERYSKSLMNRLFKKYPYYGMTVDSYCCYGLENCCWQDPFEEGIWSLSIDDVKQAIIHEMKYKEDTLYNIGKYGSRFFISEDEKQCSIFVYTRDKHRADLHIYFDTEEI